MSDPRGELTELWDYLAGTTSPARPPKRLAGVETATHGPGHPPGGTLLPADAIVCLGSANLGTARRAAALFQAGVAPRVVVSGGARWHSGAHETEADAFAAELVGRGVPAAVIVLERQATNTGENARLAIDVLARTASAPKRIVVVAFPTLVRRAAATFARIHPSLAVEVLPSFAGIAEFEGSEQRAVELVVNEVARLATYPARGLTAPIELPPWVTDVAARLAERLRATPPPVGAGLPAPDARGPRTRGPSTRGSSARHFPYLRSANCVGGA